MDTMLGKFIERSSDVYRAINMLISVAGLAGRNLQMPGIPRYQPKNLKPYFGHDQWAGWLIIVEWFWMKTLNRIGVMPDEDAAYLTEGLLFDLLSNITTTMQDEEENKPHIRHDIIALLNLMKSILPLPLHRWLHYCATSYDPISTAYALQYQASFVDVIYPQMEIVSDMWRSAIDVSAETTQLARTHLVTALPVTVGSWEAQLHNRFVRNCRGARIKASQVEGKFSGATGTFNSQIALIGHAEGEYVLLDMLGLVKAPISTQIAPPESLQHCYHELLLVAGVLGNLGEDGRILQAVYKELVSTSSTSSAMSHKILNPIGWENLLGMSRLVTSSYDLIGRNMISDFHRDLAGSCCMRAYPMTAIYTYQMLLTAERCFRNLKVHNDVCLKNFEAESRFLAAEILHLSLGDAGLPNAHHFVNETVIPLMHLNPNLSLGAAMTVLSEDCVNTTAAEAWSRVPESVKEQLHQPEKYIGLSVQLARIEVANVL